MENNGTPNMDGTQSFNQAPSQPVAPQPGPIQPLAQPIAPVPDDAKSKKKIGIMIGCSVGVLVLIVAAVFVFTTLTKHSEKKISCVTETTAMSIPINIETNIIANDGELSSGEMIVSINLKDMSSIYKNNEKELVDKLIEGYKNRSCKDSCVFDYDYNEGDNVKFTMQYDKESTDQLVRTRGSEKDMSAQAIADKVQETLESSDTTCTQY